MNHLGLLAVLSTFGGVIGAISFGFPWAFGLSGIDLIDGYSDGFQRILPIVILLIMVSIVLLTLMQVLRLRWFIPFITFFLAVATMLLTSIFAMWEVDGVTASSEAGLGLWMSYAAGTVVLLGSAASYKIQFRYFADQ